MIVILDNSTRWNSTYNSIQRGLKLREAINVFLYRFGSEINEDHLTTDEWQQLEAIEEALRPFKEMTLRLEGLAKQGSHGVIWEALPALDLLLSHVEQKRDIQQAQERLNGRRAYQNTPRGISLATRYQNAWETLTKYNNITDKSHLIYAAATLLNPCCRKTYFTKRWTGEAASYIDIMIEANRTLFQAKYKQNAPVLPAEEFQSTFDAFMSNIQDSTDPDIDEFDTYLQGPALKYQKWHEKSIFTWWMESPFDLLRPWAFDTLSIPAMSAEMERCFSQASRIITVDRNRLSVDNLERLLCMKHWLDHSYI